MHWVDMLGYYLTVLRVHWAEVVGYLASLLTIAAFSSKTMIPLRILGISTNCFNIIYGVFAQVYPPLMLHVILLPLNSLRLYQSLRLIENVKAASQGDLAMDWLMPFMRRRTAKAGEVIFRSGDVASEMFYTMTGRYRLVEIDTEIAPGEVIGELGLIAPENKRTLTFACVADGEMLAISYSHVKELYFQNPRFGFYFLQLISQRLFRDIGRLRVRLSTT